MSEIKSVFAREILDSRGMPALEVEVETAKGVFGRASVPSGASTGKREALELRDGDPRRFRGKGLLKAIYNVEELIAPEISGMDICDQWGIDQEMIDLDGTSDKSRLGANAVLGVSLACARAAALELGLPLYRYLGGTNGRCLPVPLLNVFNGGAHHGSPVACQEFMLRCSGAENFEDAMEMAYDVTAFLREELLARYGFAAVGDEGGFALPGIRGGTVEVLELLNGAIRKASLTPGKEISIALDMAASTFFKEGLYDYSLFEKGTIKRTAEEQIAYLCSLVEDYGVSSIEDGLAETEWDSWQTLTARLGSRCQLVGDDLFVSNAALLRQGIEKKCANAVLLKPNQIGTLTECCHTACLAKEHGYKLIVSHRSGETDDSFIADLAVALNAGQIKAGAPVRGERVAKYNQLLRIAEQLGDGAIYGTFN